MNTTQYNILDWERNIENTLTNSSLQWFPSNRRTLIWKWLYHCISEFLFQVGLLPSAIQLAHIAGAHAPKTSNLISKKDQSKVSIFNKYRFIPRFYLFWLPRHKSDVIGGLNEPYSVQLEWHSRDQLVQENGAVFTACHQTRPLSVDCYLGDCFWMRLEYLWRWEL